MDIENLKSLLSAVLAEIEAPTPTNPPVVATADSAATPEPAPDLAPVVDVLAPVVDDIAQLHARVDGVASAIVAAVQSLDAKIDSSLDVASGWALHPKVAAAGAGGLVSTVAAYVLQLNTVHVAGGNTTVAAVTAGVAALAGWLKKA